MIGGSGGWSQARAPAGAATPAHRYRADIDGLRALAVLSVVFFHAGLGVPGGYVGVDVFFVISGFLITGLIFRELEERRFSFQDFYARRARRIAPAAIVVMAAVVGAAFVLYLPRDLEAVAQSAVAQSVFSSNIYFWRHAHYFSIPNEDVPLLHMWSLAVEEQFYLFFPLVLWTLHKVFGGGRAWITGSLCVMGVASFGLSVVLLDHEGANFYLLPSRAWELIMGGVLAIHLDGSVPVSRRGRIWGSFSGMVLLLGAFFLYSEGIPFPGPAALPPCLGTALVIWSLSSAQEEPGPGLVYRFLTWRPVVFVGLISYSLYLWHWPVLAFMRYWLGSPVGRGWVAVALAGSLVLAVTSWRYVEQPFRRRRLAPRRVQIFAFAGASSLAVALCSVLIIRQHGAEWRFPASARNFLHPGAMDYFPFDPERVLRGDLPMFGAGNGEDSPLIVLWGDSHAQALEPLFQKVAKEKHVRVAVAVHSATPPALGFYNRNSFGLRGAAGVAFNAAVLRYVQEHKPVAVVLAANWQDYDAPEELRARFIDSMVQTVRTLEAAGCSVWFVENVPRPRGVIPRMLAGHVAFGFPIELTDVPTQEAWDARSIPLYGRMREEGVHYVRTEETFLDPARQHYIVEEDGQPLYRDDHHLTPAGALMLRGAFHGLFDSVTR